MSSFIFYHTINFNIHRIIDLQYSLNRGIFGYLFAHLIKTHTSYLMSVIQLNKNEILLISNILSQALFQAPRAYQHSGDSASILQDRGSSSRVSSKSRDKRYLGKSREAAPRSWSNGEAGSSVENAAEGTTVPSTASTISY